MIRKIFTTLLTILALLSLVFTFLFTYDVLEQYGETMDWQQNTLYADIHKAPPNLAKNYIPPNEQELYVRLTGVNLALEEIEADEKVDLEKIDRYWVIYSDANSITKRMEEEETLPEGTSKKNLNRLHSYIQTEDALEKAYEVVDIEKMEKLSQTFANRLNNEKNSLDQYYLSKLRELSVEYAELDQFSKEILSLLGVVESDVLAVDVQVSKSVTEDILARIDNTNMNRFKHIRDIEEVLRSESWNKILSHNALTREYYSWKESERVLKALLHTSYKPVSDFKTYEDVIQYDPSLTIAEREGYELEIDSPVQAVYYHGEELDEKLYIKKGITLHFDIDYEFTEVEIEEEEIEEEIDDDFDTQEDIEREPATDQENNQSNTDEEGQEDLEGSQRPGTDKDFNIDSDNNGNNTENGNENNETNEENNNEQEKENESDGEEG